MKLRLRFVLDSETALLAARFLVDHMRRIGPLRMALTCPDHSSSLARPRWISVSCFHP